MTDLNPTRFTTNTYTLWRLPVCDVYQNGRKVATFKGFRAHKEALGFIEEKS